MATMQCGCCGRAVTACEVARGAIGVLRDEGARYLLWNCGCAATHAAAIPLRATARVLRTMLAMRRAAAQARAEAA